MSRIIFDISPRRSNAETLVESGSSTFFSDKKRLREEKNDRKKNLILIEFRNNSTRFGFDLLTSKSIAKSPTSLIENMFKFTKQIGQCLSIMTDVFVRRP